MSTPYERYVEVVEKCSIGAQGELERLVASLDLTQKKASRDILLAEVPRIADKWGSIAAAAAAEYYEQERHRQIGGNYRAKVYPASKESTEQLMESIRYACGFLFDDEGDGDGER